MRRAGSFALVIALVTACAGKDGYGGKLTTPDEEDFEKKLRAALRESAAECCRQHGWAQPVPNDDIHSVVLIVDDVHVPNEAPDSVYRFDEKQADMCLAAVRSHASSCHLYQWMPECRQVWHKDAPLGAKCVRSADCAPGAKVRCSNTCAEQASSDDLQPSWDAFYRRDFFCAPGWKAR